MSLEDLPGRAFEGFVKADEPLELIQRKDSLLGYEDDAAAEIRSLSSQESSEKEDQSEYSTKPFLGRLRDFAKKLPFFRKTNDSEVAKDYDDNSEDPETDETSFIKKKRDDARKTTPKRLKKEKIDSEDESDDEIDTDEIFDPKEASDDESNLEGTLSKEHKYPRKLAKKLATEETLDSQEESDGEFSTEETFDSKEESISERIGEDESESFSSTTSDEQQDDSRKVSSLSNVSELEQQSTTTTLDSRTDEDDSGDIPEKFSSYKESTIVEIPEDYDIPDIKFEKEKVKVYRKRHRGIGRKMTRICPYISRLLFSKRTQYKGVKAMLGFPIGVAFGYVLHKLVLERLQLSPFANKTLKSLLALCLGIGYATSTEIRCICFLTIPSLFSKSGRAYISTFLISFLIFGPISNIISNARESTRVMTCIASLNVNHTVERFKLMFKPVKDIVMDFVRSGEKIQEGTKQIGVAHKQIDEEVRDDEEVKMDIAEAEELDKETGQKSRVDVIKKKFSGVKAKFGDDSEAKYGMKSEFRCEGIFTKGVKGCYDSFGAAYDRCHSYLPIIGYLLCWPVKLTFICDIASSFMGRRACDSNDALSPGFGESMDTADAVQKEFDKEFEMTLQYKLDIPVEEVDQITPQDISASMQHQFEKKKKKLEFFLNLMNRVMVFIFLLIFNASRKYCDQYLRSIEFDNKYITSYFRHIDRRRQLKGKQTLLPLKKGEKLELVEPFKIKFSRDEKVKMILNSVRITGELVTVSIILAFDWIFYEFLMLIQRHAHVTYYQTGVHHIKMTVYGDGFIGNMVRSILKGFDKKHTTDQVTSTAACLPQPTKLDEKSVICLFLMFLLLFFLMLFESYALRWRRVICSFFYPKREKKRVLFLYNDRLKKRKSYMRHMRHHVRKMARKQAIAIETGVFASLRHLYPNFFGWVGKFGLGKRKCLVCEEVESGRITFVVCSDECPFSYCPECWAEMKGRCYVCLPDDDDDSPLSDDDSLQEEED